MAKGSLSVPWWAYALAAAAIATQAVNSLVSQQPVWTRIAAALCLVVVVPACALAARRERRAGRSRKLLLYVPQIFAEHILKYVQVLPIE